MPSSGDCRSRIRSRPPKVCLNALLLAALAGLSCVTAASDEQPDELGELSVEQLMGLRVETVYSASRYEQQVARAPASVTIVTADEIRGHGYRTLAEILRGVRGLYVTYDRNYSNFGIRGFGRPGDFNTRILLMVDGHRMNDNLYDSALIGTEAILDVDLIERVEVIRGPGSSIYGSNAFFGVINVITRKGGLIDGLEASTEGGSFDSYRGRLTWGKQATGGLEAAVSGSLFDTHGQERLYYEEFDTAANNNGIAQAADDENSRNLYGSVSYLEWTLSTAYSLRNKQIPTASYGTQFNDGRERTTDERSYVDLSYAKNVLVNGQLSGRVYYDRYAYRADYPYNYAAPGDPPFVVVSHDDNYGDGVGVDVQLTHRFPDRHVVVLGSEVRESLNLYQSNYNDDPRTYNFRDNQHGRSYGLYAQDEFSVREDLTIDAGLRYDHFSNFGGALSPRLSLIYAPSQRATAKLLFGEAYRAPNAYELYAQAPGFTKTNPALDPEKIRTYELVFEQSLAPRLSFNASAYRYDIRGLISQESDPADGLQVYDNRDRVTADGLELELRHVFDNGGSIRTSYAVVRAVDRESGRELSNSPRQLGKANLIAPLWGDALRAGLEVQCASRSRTISGGDAAGFAVVNATLFGRPVGKKFDLSVSAYNLLDGAYTYPGSTGNVQDEILQDGRSVRLKATYRF